MERQLIENDCLHLYGASGHAKVIIDILKDTNRNIVCIYDDNPRYAALCGIPVLKPHDVSGPLLISIGNNFVRKRIAETAGCGFAMPAIHPSAILSASVSLGKGTVVMQGAVVQQDVSIGSHCIINTSSSVDHECKTGDFVHISPHATLCGNVRVGEGAWIGAGATVLPGISIGRWSIVGAGSVVTRDVPENVVVAGNPARTIRTVDISLLG